MRFSLQFAWSLLLVPSALLLVGTSPSYAELVSQSVTSKPENQNNPCQQPFELPQDSPETDNSETLPAPDTKDIPIEDIKIIGSTILTEADWNQYIQPSKTQKLATQKRINEIANAITDLYLKKGYVYSRAIPPDITKIQDGIVEIKVIEGSLKPEDICIEGAQRINLEYVRSRIALGAGKPLSTANLEEQLRLLRADPLFENIEASLRLGTQEGQRILRVRVTEAKPINVALSFDNYSPPSVGSERLGVSAIYRNPTGAGDELAAAYYRTTTNGSNIYDFSYKVPINAMNGTLQLRTAINNNQVTQSPFDTLKIRGESQLSEITYRQPLERSTRKEFALYLGFSVQNGQTFTFAGPTPFSIGPDDQGNSRTRVIKFGQDFIHRDEQGAWALRSQLSFGTGLFNATINHDPKPDGRFFSWLWQIRREQLLSEDHRLIAQADLQLTPHSLLPGQQFVIGGGQSVRGYRQNVRAGDNGFRLSLEDQITLSREEGGRPVLQLAPFFDMGVAWNVNNNPNRLQRQNFLAGTGLGVLLKPLPNINLRLDYSFPLIRLDDKGDNPQDGGFYFSLGYRL
ncbi:MAG: ShlB/FhaC/HecB family hemolysin secretion/activation protein [Gloeotrichia echinulata DVL01]